MINLIHFRLPDDNSGCYGYPVTNSRVSRYSTLPITGGKSLTVNRHLPHNVRRELPEESRVRRFCMDISHLHRINIHLCHRLPRHDARRDHLSWTRRPCAPWLSRPSSQLRLCHQRVARNMGHEKHQPGHRTPLVITRRVGVHLADVARQ